MGKPRKDAQRERDGSQRAAPRGSKPPQALTPDEQAALGLICRGCHCADLRVVNTVPLTKNRIRRKRVCRHCGKAAYSVEKFGVE